ncbi:unnamed protein product [Plutella xylostella]|uniref:Odorant receptor n=1 Tax=Plutella xylostella TaxID=51655 RepID=A0A8S4F5F5_PLUXY|nr:unnamed protein product [Plutella xylostella]
MIRRALAQLEDPRRPLLGPNIFLLKLTGMYLPGSRRGRALTALFHLVGLLFVSSEVVELTRTFSDLFLVMSNLKIMLLSAVCLLKAWRCIVWQASWRRVLQYVTAADLAERRDAPPPRAARVAAYTRAARRVLYGYAALTCFTSIVFVSTPFLERFTTQYQARGPEEKVNVIDSIYIAYLPFDKTTFPGNLIATLWFILVTIYGNSVMTVFDTMAMVLMVFFGAKLELIRERCAELLDAPGERPGAPGERPGARALAARFRDLHQAHVDLIEHATLFNTLTSPVLFLYVVTCSLMLCTAVYQLTLTSVSGTQKLVTAEFLIFAVAQLFLFCWLSNDVKIKSERTMEGPYHSGWLRDPRCRRELLLLSGQLARPVEFTAGPFTALSLANFINILKGAYSYYTLLKD